MSNPNPIIPPGSPLQRQHSKRNSKLVLSVFLILAVHAFILAGLLIQGCQRQDATSAGDLSTSQEPSFARMPSSAGQQADLDRQSSSVPPAQPNTSVLPPSTVMSQAPAPTPNPVPPAPLPTPTRPDAASAIGAVAEAPAAKPAPSGNPSVYVVKKGDNLTRIARAHGVSLRAIREANNLKTDRLLVGKKLKIPAADAVTEPGTPAPMASPPAVDAQPQ